MVYNKTIEREGRKASVLVRSDGSIVLTEKHDLNESYSPSMRGKPNGVILYGSPAGNKTRQANIAIFDKNGNGFIMLHYGPHANPKHHPFGKMVEGRRTGHHTHTVTHDGSHPEHSRPMEMSEDEEKYLRR
jgi:minor head protein